MAMAERATDDWQEVRTESGASARVEQDGIVLRDASGGLVARYDAATGELHLSVAADLRLSAKGRLVLEGEAIDLRSKRVAIEAEDARFALGRFQLEATMVIERAMHVLRTATGLVETRAAEARTIVAHTLELLARRTTLVSEEDTRIDGKRVRLG